MEREVGGGIGMGKTCKLKDVSFQCMTKFTTNKKKKEKKIKKIKSSHKDTLVSLTITGLGSISNYPCVFSVCVCVCVERVCKSRELRQGKMLTHKSISR